MSLLQNTSSGTQPALTETALRAIEQAKFQSFWRADASAPAPQAALAQDIDVDLLIVGGGFTGLWTALKALEAEPNRSVALIEARTLAHGASGRPCAMFNTSVLHGLTNAERLFPKDLPLLERLGRANFDELIASLKLHKIDANLELNGELTIAIGDEAVPDLKLECQKHEFYQHDSHFLDRGEARALLNSPLIAGAMHTRSKAGTLHPAKLCWGLARAAQDLGLKLYENSPLVKLEQDGRSIRVLTHKACIKAQKVLLATNAYAAGHKKIRQRVTAIRDRILVTEPLSRKQIADLNWQGRQAVYDTRLQLNYMRLTPDNRMLFGGRLGYFYGDKCEPAIDQTAAPYALLAENWLKTFPQLAGTKVDYLWGGPLAVTTRMAVHVQPYYEGRVLYVGGYSGFGVSASHFSARLGLAILDDKPHPAKELDLVKVLPSRIPPEPFRTLGAKITMRALDGVDEKGGWRHPWLKLVKAMGFPLY